MAMGARGFLTVINSSDLKMRDLVLTAQRLRLAAPEKTAAEAAFSLREFLSEDIRSLAEQFNIGRGVLLDIKNANIGNPEGMLNALSQYMDSIGLTQDALVEMGETGVNAFQLTSNALREAGVTAFTPFLNNIVLPLLNSFTDFLTHLKDTNPALLQIAGGLLVVAAAFAPLLLGLNQAINAWRLLQTFSKTNLGVGLANSPVAAGIGRAAIGIGAVAVGADAGVSLLNAAVAAGGRQGDLSRIAAGEDTGTVVKERLAQFISVAVGSIVIVLRSGAKIIENAFNVLGNVLDFAASVMERAFGDLEITIGKLLQGIGQLMVDAGLSGGSGVRQAGNNLEITGNERKALAQENITYRENYGFGNVGISEAQRAELQAQMAADVTSIFNFLASILGVAAINTGQAATAAGEAIDLGWGDVGDALKKAAASDVWAKIAEKVEEFNTSIGRTIEDRATGVSRDNQDFDRGRLRNIADENKSKAREDEKQKQREQDLIDAMAKITDDANDEEIKIRQKFHDEEVKDLKEHNDRLADLQRKAHWELFDAIAAGDETAAQKAVRNLIDATNKENKEYTEKQDAREDDLQDEIKAIEDRRDERIKEAAEELDRMRAEFKQSRQEREDDFNLRLAREDEDRFIRAQRDQQDFDLRLQRQVDDHNKEINELIRKTMEEAGVWTNFQTALSNTFAKLRTDFGGMVDGMVTAVRTNTYYGTGQSAWSGQGSGGNNTGTPGTTPQTGQGMPSNPTMNQIHTDFTGKKWIFKGWANGGWFPYAGTGGSGGGGGGGGGTFPGSIGTGTGWGTGTQPDWSLVGNNGSGVGGYGALMGLAQMMAVNPNIFPDIADNSNWSRDLTGRVPPRGSLPGGGEFPQGPATFVVHNTIDARGSTMNPEELSQRLANAQAQAAGIAEVRVFMKLAEMEEAGRNRDYE